MTPLPASQSSLDGIDIVWVCVVAVHLQQDSMIYNKDSIDDNTYSYLSLLKPYYEDGFV